MDWDDLILIPQSLIHNLLLDHNACNRPILLAVAWTRDGVVLVEVSEGQWSRQNLDLLGTTLGGDVEKGFVLPVEVVKGFSLPCILNGQLFNLKKKG